MNVYTCHLVKDNLTVLGGVKRLSLGRAMEALVMGASGSIDNTAVFAAGDAPLLSVETVHIAEWITACGMAKAVDAAGLTVGFQKMLATARAGTLAHVLATMYAGLISCQSIGGQHGSEAKATYEVHGIDDGTNGAMSVATGVTLTGNQTVTQAYTIGPFKVNGTSYETQGWEFRPGHLIAKKGHGGRKSPQFAGINRRNPEITMSSEDFAALDLEAVDISSLVLYLRKMGRTAPVADATAEHISFTFTDGLVWAESAEAGDAGEGTVTLQARPVWDGTNDVVQISTAAAIA